MADDPVSDGMSLEEITVRLHRAMDAAVGLPSQDIDNIEIFIRAGEELEAFETLCTQIYEYDIQLDADIIQQLAEVGTTLGAETGFARRAEG
ncbi:MafI family immunity protein [Arthrobacter sp. R1-13]